MLSNKCGNIMDKNSILDIFLDSLFTYLVGEKPKCSNELKIFRKHNNKLEQSGDLSFPLNISGWHRYANNSSSNIYEYIQKFCQNKLEQSDFIEIVDISKKWNNLSISKIELHKNKLNLFLHRYITFNKVLNVILVQNEKYGCTELNFKSIRIKIEAADETSPDLTLLRLQLTKKVTINMLKCSGCDVIDNENEDDSAETIYFTNKSESKCTSKKIVCGVVINNKFGKKNTETSVEDFYCKRTVDMQLMAQHKYGLRVTSEPGWSDFFKRLGNAAVIIDLLHVKPVRPVIVNEDNSASTCSKGASFILYNCARLSEIFKKFDKKVETGEVPPLPNIEDVDFNLLNQSEEWELLYVYLMQYPSTVMSCVVDILDCRLNTHNLCVFLDSLCSTFSVYYRRVRVLTEARPHLFPVMYARIYLLKAIQQVLHNALALLDIPPIKQM